MKSRLLPLLVLTLSGCFGPCKKNPVPPDVPPEPVSARAQEGAPTGPTFSFRLPGEPETLDWNLAHTMIETYVLMNLMEGLVSVEDDLQVRPALAESWKISADKKTYTFEIRKDVVWSDGVPLRAKDFWYSWKRLLSPATAASYAYFLFDVIGAQDYNAGKITDFSQVGIKVLGPSTFQVTLKNPIAHWIYLPSFWVTFPLREDVVAKHGTAWPKPGRMVTLGPFLLDSYVMSSRIVLKENPKYYRHKGNIKQIVAQIVNDSSTALKLYETDKLDFVTDLSNLDLKNLQGRPDLKTFRYLKTAYIGFSINKPPADQVGVRKAIAMAIDKKKLGDILAGGQTPATTFVPPPMLGYSESVGLKFDPVAAKRELQAAGIDRYGKISIELLTPSWDKNVTLAQFIEQQLKENLGIQLKIQPLDHRSFRVQLDLHAYAMFFGSWGADYPDPDNFLSVFLGSSGNNRTKWKNPAYDEAVLRARGSSDQVQRAKDYLLAQKILIEQDVPVIPLFYEPNKAMVKPRVKGLSLNPLNYLLLRTVRIER